MFEQLFCTLQKTLCFINQHVCPKIAKCQMRRRSSNNIKKPRVFLYFVSKTLQNLVFLNIFAAIQGWGKGDPRTYINTFFHKPTLYNTVKTLYFLYFWLQIIEKHCICYTLFHKSAIRTPTGQWKHQKISKNIEFLIFVT